MNEHVDRMKNEINITYEQCDQEFNTRKENALNNDDREEMSLKEVRLRFD
jgi:hypothetical protein